MRDLNNTLTNVAPYNQLLHANKLIPTKNLKLIRFQRYFVRSIWENSYFSYWVCFPNKICTVNSPKKMITGLINESPEAEKSINAKTINIILMTRANQPSVSPTFLPFELRASVIVMVLLNWFIELINWLVSWERSTAKNRGILGSNWHFFYEKNRIFLQFFPCIGDTVLHDFKLIN